MADTTVAGSSIEDLAGKYLTFRLASEEYGLPILTVREIIGVMDITPVPRSPAHVRGVINLRGKIIPVSDLRVQLEMGRADETSDTCIIVVDIARDEGQFQIGILVDAVSEVIDITPDELEPAPVFGSGVDCRFIRAIAKKGGEVKILLDIERALRMESGDELEGLASPGSSN